MFALLSLYFNTMKENERARTHLNLAHLFYICRLASLSCECSRSFVHLVIGSSKHELAKLSHKSLANACL